MAIESNTIDHATLQRLVEAGAVRGADVVGLELGELEDGETASMSPIPNGPIPLTRFQCIHYTLH